MITVGDATISEVIALILKKCPDMYFYEKGHGLIKKVDHHILGELFYKVDVIKEHSSHGTSWHFRQKLIGW